VKGFRYSKVLSQFSAYREGGKIAGFVFRPFKPALVLSEEEKSGRLVTI